MSENEKREILERVAALSEEDQHNLAFFVAGMVAKSNVTAESTEQKTDAPVKE